MTDDRRSSAPYGGTNSPKRFDPVPGAKARPVGQPDNTSALNRLTQPTERRATARKRSWLLMLCATPLLAAALGELMTGDPLAMARNVILFGLIAGGTFVIREGVTAHAEYDRRAVAAPPALPRKLLGSLMIGAGVAGAAMFGWSIGTIPGIILGGLATFASVLAFGMDPLTTKGDTGVAGLEARAVIEAIEEAEEKIRAIEEEGSAIKDRPLRDRIGRVARGARVVLRRVEDDPSDLRRIKRFLKVYLDGLLEATRKYAKGQSTIGDGETYVKYRSLLDDMERSFERTAENLLANDQMDLDVEIDVLAERLKNERA